jgi:hypothetical protein
VLLCRSAVTPIPASSARNLCGARAQRAPQFAAEGAHDPAANHVQAPQEQGNSAHQVKKKDASHRTARLVSLLAPIRLRPVLILELDIQTIP